MDFAVLKKKISSYKIASGRVTKIPDELVMEILAAWEQWSGPALGFYSELGGSAKKNGQGSRPSEEAQARRSFSRSRLQRNQAR